ncbi:putative sulfate exporter family transporter [Alteromonas mediterranea]|uniref:YeiH family protein n=1 Tax=Alteromonas mediterranea TaxID=314275 RepID=UPI001130F16A|nr:putative sulfate exporter family transporter [Alteromonas mediterranea]QDG40029.1 putative sulfate exporter family transporter [Alteromonas mediterranea]QGX63497.1 putative sulfate exporter family transporter [Alteromonas mediterranea]
MNDIAVKCKNIWPGLGIATITGMAALFLSEHYNAPAMLFALLLGMAVSFLYQNDTPCACGIDFTASTLLRAGVVLLGLRIALGDLAVLGWQTALMLAGAIFTTIVLGVGLAKALGLQKRFGALTGGSVAICGASAALAISTILPKGENHERDTLLTVIGVTAMSTIAMVLYPIIAGQLGMTDTEAGIFLGGTIHDVAQVVGAGYSVSESAGDMATLTKLVRVAMLMPVVLIMMLVIKRFYKASTQAEGGEVPKMPLFLIGFIALMLLNSFVSLPEFVIEAGTQVSRFFLVVSITAIGMKSNLGKLAEVGMFPIVMILVETLWIALLILGFLYAM